MKNLLSQLRKRKKEILSIAAQYGVSNIRVFGSVVRGEEREDSDIDLLVTTDSNVSLFRLIKLELLLSEIFGKKTQIISDKAVNKHLKEIIFKEAVSL